MFAPDQYELLDFGEGRRLERFGPYLLDRPAPSAERKKKQQPQLWKSAAARFQRTDKESGQWRGLDDLPERWPITAGPLTFEIKPTPFGHVGIFAEQAANWQWIARQVERAARPLRVLNLFAYTGGSTLAAAAAGAEVTHVDSAKNIVAWARRNAAASGLAEAPVRWMVEDAAKFVGREVKRGRQYDAVILDPPSYGHGPKGEAWQLARDLPRLLKSCAELTAESRAFLLLTCHTPGFDPPVLEALLADTLFGHCQAGAQARRLFLNTDDERKLSSGVVCRWPK